MITLERTNRFTPFLEIESLTELFEVEVVADVPVGHRRTDLLYLYGSKAVFQAPGLVYARPTKALLDVIQGLSIFNADRPGEEHFLEIVRRSDNSLVLFLRFQKILGSYALAQVSEEQISEVFSAEHPA